MDKHTTLQDYRQHMAALGFDTSDFSDDELIDGVKALAEVTQATVVGMSEQLTSAFIELGVAASVTMDSIIKGMKADV